MVKIDWNDTNLKEAILGWSGYGKSPFPQKNNIFLEQRFGGNYRFWLELIDDIFDEFYKSEAYLIAADLDDMRTRSINDFKKIHKNVPDEILQALVWCYTFDYR